MMKRTSIFLALSVVAALAMALCGTAQASLILAGPEGVYDNVMSGTNGSVTANTSTADLWLFDFAHPNGSGGGTPIAGGLDLNGYTVSRNSGGDYTNTLDTRTKIWRLNLDSGAIFDSSVGQTGKIIASANQYKSTGSIDIVNAGNISLNTISTNSLGGVAGAITVNHTGDLTAAFVTAVAAPSGSGTQRMSYGIKLDGTGALSVGTLQAGRNATDGGLGGYGVDIQHYTSVDITTTFEAKNKVNFVTPADVQIIHIGTGGVTLPTVDISNASQLNAAAEASDLTITTTGHVTINGNLTFTSADATNGDAGDATISAGNLLQIKGTINGNSAHGNAYDGYLDLTTTSAAGANPSIILGEAGVPGGLDLSNVRYVRFAASNHVSVIYQTISGFTGDGSTQFQVSAPGDIVYYADAANAGLLAGVGGPVYDIGGGGFLEPLSMAVPEPATMAFLAIGGLTMAGAAIRRRLRATA